MICLKHLRKPQQSRFLSVRKEIRKQRAESTSKTEREIKTKSKDGPFVFLAPCLVVALYLASHIFFFSILESPVLKHYQNQFPPKQEDKHF